MTQAAVSIGSETAGKVGRGLCVFVGVGKDDSAASAAALAEKTSRLRIFADAQGKMNLSVADIAGEVLVVSQFTLYGDCRKGNRPSFTDAAPPAEAERLYNSFVEELRRSGLIVATGKFQAVMQIALVNDGPATFVLEA